MRRKRTFYIQILPKERVQRSTIQVSAKHTESYDDLDKITWKDQKSLLVIENVQ